MKSLIVLFVFIICILSAVLLHSKHQYGLARVNGCLFSKIYNGTYVHDLKCDNPKHFDTIDGCLYKKEYFRYDNTTVYSYTHSELCTNNIAHPERYKDK